MTRSSRISSIVALATALALACAFAWALPGAAAAQPGDRTFEETFPTAGAICAKIAAGTENRRLKAAATQASAACSTLEGEFKSAQSAVLTARSTLTPEIEAARSGAAASCRGTRDAGPGARTTPEQTPNRRSGGASRTHAGRLPERAPAEPCLDSPAGRAAARRLPRLLHERVPRPRGVLRRDQRDRAQRDPRPAARDPHLAARLSAWPAAPRAAAGPCPGHHARARQQLLVARRVPGVSQDPTREEEAPA